MLNSQNNLSRDNLKSKIQNHSFDFHMNKSWGLIKTVELWT